ncbi:MAG: AAA family ATPase [Steroidobacteraceae bacterium]
MRRSDGIDRSAPFTEHFQLGAYHSHWDYRDAHGNVVMRVCRWEQPGGKKDIRPLVRTVDGWKWGHHPTPRPLFQLDRLTNEPEKPVIVVEGEKTALAAQKLYPDHIATTWPGGAAAMGQADLSALAGRDVTLVPDCDQPGRKAMSWALNRLKASARSVRVVDPGQIAKGLPEGWDLADALAEQRDVSGWLVRTEGSNPKEPPRIVLRSALELAQTVVNVWWLLEPYLERNASILLFGDLGTLKSFLALHWALEAALAGHPVVYLSAEGKGLPRRLKGWARHRWGDGWEKELAKLPFFGIERPLNLSAAVTVAELIDAMDQGAIEPALIVIDTISKNSDGRIETSNEEAQIYLNQIDQELRGRFDATVLMVHHCGHAEKGRARGPYSLMANTDANYLIERPDLEQLLITVKAGRMKDTPSPAPFSFEGIVVETGDVDSHGKAVTTLVLRAAASPTPSPQTQKKPGKNQQAAVNGLVEWSRSHPNTPNITTDELTAILSAQGLKSRQRRHEAIAHLVSVGVLTPSVGGHSVNRGAL